MKPRRAGRSSSSSAPTHVVHASIRIAGRGRGDAGGARGPPRLGRPGGAETQKEARARPRRGEEAREKKIQGKKKEKKKLDLTMPGVEPGIFCLLLTTVRAPRPRGGGGEPPSVSKVVRD